MQPSINIVKDWYEITARHVPRQHLLAAAAVSALILFVLLLLPSGDVSASRQQSVTLNFPDAGADLEAEVENYDLIESEPAAKAHPDTPVDPTDPTAPSSQTHEWHHEEVRSGDNLTSIFKRLSLTARDVYDLANAGPEAKVFAKIRPGERLSVAFAENQSPVAVRYERSKLEYYDFIRTDSGFSGQKILRQPERLPNFREGVIENSLFLDAEQAGMSPALIMQLANIFGWDIDFALDLRKGDSFSVLYEENYLDGEKIGNGDILAAEFSNQGEVFKAVRFIEADGAVNYYAPDGTPMRKAFLRAPLDFTRISSNFNLRRKHPIHKMIKAHRGVDYAAPRGTPVYAAGDGKVVAAGYSKANGNYVFIQHGQQYTTKYLHLHRKAVRRGQSVKQRQVIGAVGSTGYATGPHLHYEFLVNGVHRNPRTVELPEADPIPSALLASFTQQTEPLLQQLASLRNTQLALVTE